MSETMAETILTRRSSAESRSRREQMSLCTQTVKNGTAEEQQPNDHTLDLDSAHPIEVDGGDVVFCDTYVRTDDGNALRFDGDQPVATAAVYSETKLRHALAEAGYAREHIEFALDTRLDGEQALAAARIAESQTHGHAAELVADGGTDRPDDCRCEEFEEMVCPPCSMVGFDTRADVESMSTVRSERADMGGGETTGVEEL